MKKLILSLATILFLSACSDSSSDNKEFETTAVDQTEEASEIQVETINRNPNAFEENLSSFKDCRAASDNRADCKEYLAKAVCEYYGIKDLMDGSNYLDYDKISAKLEELDSWQKVGSFNEENIQMAIEQLNGFDKPVLIFNKNDSYVHVVALTPNGSIIKSRKWGNISVPACVSYFPTKNRAPKSFIKNGINYAFGSADGLEI